MENPFSQYYKPVSFGIQTFYSVTHPGLCGLYVIVIVVTKLSQPPSVCFVFQLMYVTHCVIMITVFFIFVKIK